AAVDDVAALAAVDGVRAVAAVNDVVSVVAGDAVAKGAAGNVFKRAVQRDRGPAAIIQRLEAAGQVYGYARGFAGKTEGTRASAVRGVRLRTTACEVELVAACAAQNRVVSAAAVQCRGASERRGVDDVVAGAARQAGLLDTRQRFRAKAG